MMKLSKLFVILALPVVGFGSGCTRGDGPIDPVKLQDNARLAGEAAVMTYFTVQPDQQDKAVELLPVVSAIRKVATAIPAGGFIALKPQVDAVLEKELKDDKAIYLIPAKRLAEIILEELDKKAARDGWKSKLDSVVAVIGAFLEGSEDALKKYATAT